MKLDDVNYLINCSSKNKPGRNFNFFVTDNLERRNNISITFHLDKRDYWGLRSEFSEEEMRNWIVGEKSPLGSGDALNQAFQDFSDDGRWNMPSVEEAKSKAFFKRTILSFSQHFYFVYILDNAANKILSSLWDLEKCNENCFDFVDINSDLKNLNEVIKNEENIIFRKINGRLPNKFIDILSRNGMRYVLENPYIHIFKDKNNTHQGNNIKDLYKDQALPYYLKCVSKTFYSGSLARVKRVNKTNLLGNANIHSYAFELSTISYATHLGFKDPRMNYVKSNCHDYFLEEEIRLLKEADKKENELQKNFYDSCIQGNETEPAEDKIINFLNDYLKKSIYTHGMNVSGNIITKDGQLIYAKRGKDTWDSSVLYCSVNGVCEVDDDNVFFYNHSVDCDRPKIGEYNTNQGNFGGELSRETFAELGLTIKPTEWKYYGFSIMGYHNANNKAHSFPLHINVLAYCKTQNSISEIRATSATAVESEENENIKGLSLVTKSEWIQNLKSRLKPILSFGVEVAPDLLILNVVGKKFLENINVEKANVKITNFFGFVRAILLKINIFLRSIGFAFSESELVDKISLGISLIIIFKIIYTFIKEMQRFFKKKNIVQTKNIFYKTYTFKGVKKTMSFLNRKYPNAHSLFLLMTLLFYNFEKSELPHNSEQKTSSKLAK